MRRGQGGAEQAGHGQLGKVGDTRDGSAAKHQSADHGAKSHEIATLLSEVLENPETKVVIFSQWLRMHDLLIERIAERGWDYVAFHGGLDGKQRKAHVDRFRDDPRCRLFLSTDAGGVGLNLQFCGYVFLFDRWWNPAVEDQAINCAHRIGMTGPVTVTRFLTMRTIEERINQVLSEKRELFDTIFSDAARPKSLGLTQKEIFGLFNLRCRDAALEVNLDDVAAVDQAA